MKEDALWFETGGIREVIGTNGRLSAFLRPFLLGFFVVIRSWVDLPCLDSKIGILSSNGLTFSDWIGIWLDDDQKAD